MPRPCRQRELDRALAASHGLFSSRQASLLKRNYTLICVWTLTLFRLPEWGSVPNTSEPVFRESLDCAQVPIVQKQLHSAVCGRNVTHSLQSDQCCQHLGCSHAGTASAAVAAGSDKFAAISGGCSSCHDKEDASYPTGEGARHRQ